jgi:hypothetical protein
MLTRSWKRPGYIGKTILYYHDPTIFSKVSGDIEPTVRNLIEIEFSELKGDILAFLNGE